MFDPITIWTALGVLAVVIGGVAGVVRNGDNKRIELLESKVDKLGTDTAEKAHKDEVARIEARFEREISDLRYTMKNGFDRIDQKLDEMNRRWDDKFERLMERIMGKD